MPTGSILQPIQHSYLSPPFEKAKVYDAMRMGVFSCPADTPLRDVARMMATYRIHAVVVSDRREDSRPGAPAAIVSDLDLARCAPQVGKETAGSVADTELLTVAADESLERATQLMVEHDVSHLVVVQRGSGHPVGVLSTLDLAGVLGWGEAV